MLKDNIKKKVKLLDTATDIFFKKIIGIERLIMRQVKALLSKFDTQDGNYRNIARNRRKLLSLDSAILSILNKGNLSDDVKVFLKNFDQIERLNRLIYEGYLDDEDITKLARLDFDIEKQIRLDDITLGLTQSDILKANIVKPIRDVIFESVRFELSITDVEKRLRNEIITQDGSNSRLLRYTRQISQDALSQYDGVLNDSIRDELGLDGFFYLGSVIKTTRQNCFDMVRGVGKYSDFAIRPGTYRVEDIPAIISKAKKCSVHHSSAKKDCGSGFNTSITPQTFARYRMGYGCRHSVSYFRLLSDDIPRKLKGVL